MKKAYKAAFKSLAENGKKGHEKSIFTVSDLPLRSFSLTDTFHMIARRKLDNKSRKKRKLHTFG